MSADKHIIYLSKRHQLPVQNGQKSNVFMFNENGARIQAQWIKKSIESCNGCFVIMDHNNAILNECERVLTKKNYFIENINFSHVKDSIKINPFDLVKDTSEIHFMFLNFLYAMWDNQDNDIPAMSNLIDAFASCVFFMFKDNREKQNMRVLKKMISSVKASVDTEDGQQLMSDAIFDNIQDQNSMPCKYYAQFKRAAGERSEEIADKVVRLFDSFTDSDFELMSKTDDCLAEEFNSKTAIFINANKESEEHSAKLMATLLNYFIQRVNTHKHVLFVVDKLEAKSSFISLPHWMQDVKDNNMSFIVISNDLTGFMKTKRTEKYFRNIQKESAAFVLLNKNETTAKYADSLPVTEEDMAEYLSQEIVAVVQIPDENISEKDELI